MKIVVIDHVYLEPEHITKLKSLGDLEVFKKPPISTDELRDRVRTAGIIIVGWSHLNKDVIDSAKNLRMISIWATTCHYVDLEAAKQRGIVVTHVPGYATESVAEYTFTLLLAAVRKLLLADKHVRKGNFDWRPFGGRELAGKTIGIIGTGAIGLRVAEIAKAFKMEILGHDKYPNTGKAEELGLKYVDLDTLLKESHIVSVHVTLTPETTEMLGKRQIESMKQGAMIVNTSQGRIFDEQALADALRSGKIYSAGLDVFSEEPPRKDNSLFKLDNVVLSPHVAFHTVEAAKRCTDICVGNVAKFLDGKPENVCI